MPISAGFVKRPRVASSFEVDEAVRHASIGVKDGEHAVGEVDGKLEEAGVAVELLGGDQAAQNADGHLEVLDLHVEVEVELGQDQVLGLYRLGGKAHQDHGVEGVDRGYEQGGWVPVGVGLGQRLELVVAPGVLFVAVPGVEELGADAVGGDGGGVRCSLVFNHVTTIPKTIITIPASALTYLSPSNHMLWYCPCLTNTLATPSTAT